MIVGVPLTSLDHFYIWNQFFDILQGILFLELKGCSKSQKSTLRVVDLKGLFTKFWFFNFLSNIRALKKSLKSIKYTYSYSSSFAWLGKFQLELITAITYIQQKYPCYIYTVEWFADAFLACQPLGKKKIPWKWSKKPRTMDAQWSLFSLESQTFGLGQTT